MSRIETEVMELPLDQIERDDELQPRKEMSADVVTEYAAALDDGARFPPVDVFLDENDKHWLADGFHRYDAHARVGRDEIECRVRDGSRRDALLFSCRANFKHGLRRSNEDKWRAVDTLLADEEWGRWSDREIAEKCRVSHPFVAKVREQEVVNGNISIDDTKAAEPQTRSFISRHGSEGKRKVVRSAIKPGARRTTSKNARANSRDLANMEIFQTAVTAWTRGKPAFASPGSVVMKFKLEDWRALNERFGKPHDEDAS